MSDQNLFPLVCGVPLILFTLVVVIIATRNHFRFAKRLLNIYKDEDKINTWAKIYEKRHRLFALISIFSILALFVLAALILLGIVPMTRLLFIILVILVLLIIISGMLRLIDVKKFVK